MSKFYGVKRRPERVIEFTAENLAAIPGTSGYSDIYYDKDHPCLVAKRQMLNNGVASGIRFYANITSSQINAFKAAGHKAARLVRLSDDLETARTEATQKYEEGEAMKRKFMDLSFLRKTKKAPDPAEAILNDHEGNENPDYGRLMEVLMDAYAQAANGKGTERHANGLNFEDQDMIQVMDRVGIGFGLGQAIKKIVEGQRMIKGKKGADAKARMEFLGAAVYLAGSIIWLDKQTEK